MTSIIKADSGAVSGITGITSTADNSGTLELQATSGLVSMANVTGAFVPPTGTTAQRPASPANGAMRYNTTLNQYEVWNGYSWTALTSQTYLASYLIIAGGGSGGNGSLFLYGAAGGAGAGGLLSGSTTLQIGTTYSFVIGAGGAAVTGSNLTTNGNAGNNSTGFSLTAIGGGYGSAGTAGGNGGSGGGAYTTNTVGTGTSGQGFAGGGAAGTSYASGGGGGASAVGGTGTSTNGGSGGAGFSSSITGSSLTYAGGGGAASATAPGPVTAGVGGTGGGGAGGAFNNSGVNGTVNTGSGGGASGSTNGTTTVSSGSGGSGVVIISMPTTNYSGTTTGSPTVTANGANTVLTFTASGSYTA